MSILGVLIIICGILKYSFMDIIDEEILRNDDIIEKNKIIISRIAKGIVLLNGTLEIICGLFIVFS